MLNYHRERFRKLTFRALALRQKFIFQLGTLSPHGINERLNSFDKTKLSSSIQFHTRESEIVSRLVTLSTLRRMSKVT